MNTMAAENWNYEQMKNSLRNELSIVYESFVSIGYKLRVIQEQQLYKEDGYNSIEEFAKCEYGLSKSTVSQFININRKFSINGFSNKLKDGFLEFGVSKLSEMLTMQDADIEVLIPEVKREDIRELKRFDKQKEPNQDEEVEEITMQEIVNSYFEKFGWALDELIENDDLYNKEYFIKTVVPNGVKTYHTQTLFVIMDEEIIKARRIGAAWIPYSWDDFMKETQELASSAAELEETETPIEELVSSTTLSVEQIKEMAGESSAAELTEEVEVVETTEPEEETSSGTEFGGGTDNQEQESKYWDFEIINGTSYLYLYLPMWEEDGEPFKAATVYPDVFSREWICEVKMPGGKISSGSVGIHNNVQVKKVVEKIVSNKLREEYRKIICVINELNGGGK